MITLTKEWLLKTIAELEEERDATPGAVNEDAAKALAAMKIALASLEAEAVGEVVLGEYDDCGCHPDAKVVCIADDGQADWENFKDGTRLYTAPPAPVSVPAAMEMDDDFDSAFEHGKAVGWNACRAAMLQKVAVTPKSNDWRNYDATYDFSGKPDADLKDQPAYPETLPCPVLLEPGMKFGKGVQTEVMLKGLQRRAERNAELDAMTPEQRAEHDAGLQEFAAMLQGANCNSPVIPDGWIPVSERMPEEDGNYWGWWSESKRQGPVWFIKSDLQAQFQSSEITHWMPLPAAPQQEDIIC